MAEAAGGGLTWMERIRRRMVRTTNATTPTSTMHERIIRISNTDMADPCAQFCADWNWLATMAPTMLPSAPPATKPLRLDPVT